MATLEVPAHELKKVQVEFISLVKRGANRLPIRILKGDQAVLDLDTIFRRQDAARLQKSEADLKKADAISDAKKLLVQAGFQVIGAAGPGDANADDGEGNTAEPDSPDKNPGKPMAGNTQAPGNTNDDDGDTSPEEPDDGQGVNPTKTKPRNGSDSDASHPGSGLAEEIPYTTSVGKGDEPAAPVVKAVGPDKECPQQAAGDESDEEIEDNEAEVAGPPKNKRMAKADIALLNSVLEKMDKLGEAFNVVNKTVAGLSSEVKKIDGSVSDLGKRVESNEALVKKADKTLSALVPGQARDDHRDSARKNDTPKHFPLLDTGYTRR